MGSMLMPVTSSMLSAAHAPKKIAVVTMTGRAESSSLRGGLHSVAQRAARRHTKTRRHRTVREKLRLGWDVTVVDSEASCAPLVVRVPPNLGVLDPIGGANLYRR